MWSHLQPAEVESWTTEPLVTKTQPRWVGGTANVVTLRSPSLGAYCGDLIRAQESLRTWICCGVAQARRSSPVGAPARAPRSGRAASTRAAATMARPRVVGRRRRNGTSDAVIVTP